jgi:hypothetical protein
VQNGSSHNGGIAVTQLEEIIALGTCQSNLLQTKEEKTDTAIIKPVTMIMATVTEKTMTHKVCYLRLPPKMRVSRKISGFVTVELVDIIATLLRLCSMLNRSKSALRLLTA